MHPLRLVLALALVGGVGCVEPPTEPVSNEESPDPPAATNEPSNTGPLGCALRGEPVCELGQAPVLTVSLVNQTGSDIHLVGSLDGSSVKGRYPHCYFEVTGPDGQAVEFGGVRCAFMNTLREQDFVRVPAGGTFDPYQKIDSYGFFSNHQLSPNSLRTPGTYRIRFVYSATATDIRAWGGTGADEVAENEKLAALFARVPRVAVRSNEFVLTVVAPAR